MFSLKELVTEKLSRLLGDSSTQPYESQANSSKGSNAYRTYFSFNNRTASNDDPEPIQSDDDSKSVEPQPSGWNNGGGVSRHSEKVDYQAEYLPIDECGEFSDPLDGHETPVTAKSDIISELFEDATEPQRPWNLMPNLTEESSFIYVELYEFLQSSLPIIVKGCQWILLYSTLRDGISLSTLIRKSADLSGPSLLIVGDRKGAIFGGLLDCPLKPCPKRKYQGSNQSFVFTTRYGEPRLFRATDISELNGAYPNRRSHNSQAVLLNIFLVEGVNRYFYLCMNDILAFGGGRSFALSVDEDLLTGSSGPCDTYGNSCLAHDTEFELKNVEGLLLYNSTPPLNY